MKPYKRTTTELAPYQAAERIADLRASRPERHRLATAAVDKQDADDEEHIRSRVPDDLRHRIDVALASLEEHVAHVADKRPVSGDTHPADSATNLAPERLTGADRGDDPPIPANLARDPEPMAKPIEGSAERKAGRR